MTERELRIFECLVDTIVAPAAPLPEVSQTDAVSAFAHWLSRFPPASRLGLRAVLAALELSARPFGSPWHALSPDDRRSQLERLARTVPNGALLLDALRAAAGASYYGDPVVAAAVGYTRPRDRT